ncbi:tetraacyldisaccharide 4'-kinase [mine drainage metagenome]|uniref:tetraacyldisaccharide 4'-kinase n=2 Tax=mine drainage metagenome TaxID=410659 RepID=T1BHN6_9ZZZZ
MSLRRSFERVLLEHWYAGRLHPALYPLVPCTGLYLLVSGLKQTLEGTGILHFYRPPVPTLVIGNFTVGGTGKTPLVIWIVEALLKRGVQVGVVSRGYGGRQRGPVEVPGDGSASEYGDEPVLIARRTGVVVVIARRRFRAAEWLCRNHPVDLIVSDDGLQHMCLARDVEWVVVDGMRGWGNGWPLPAGPLREPVRHLDRVDAVLVKQPSRDAIAGIPFQLIPQDAVRLDGRERRPIQAFSGQSVHALAGIGSPDSFFALLNREGLAVKPHPIADHACLPWRQIQAWADESPVLMTEKDAVKYPPGLCAERIWYLPVQAVVERAAEALLVDALIRLIQEGDRS